LLVTGGTVTPARAGGGSFKSLTQALASHPSASVAAAATAGGATAAQQAGLGARNFANAAARFLSLQQALASQTYGGAPVPDGVTPGGLEQAPGVAGSNNSTLWSGASTTLAQSTAGGTTSVTVDQTSAVASLAWQSFNIGAHTKLIFNQSAGGSLANSWVAINSVQDPTASPSTILGQISAPGKVYILDPNGILFGTGSQVNVGGLIATTAVIAQAQLTTGTNGLISGFSLYGTATASGNGTLQTFSPTFQSAPNGVPILVEPGAVINTPVPTGTNGGGYVMLLGATVDNEGAITTPQGQTVLAAGSNFILQAGYSTNNNIATVIGSQVAVSIDGSITGTGTAALGAATNSGLIIADQGDISMIGHLVTQAGVLLATTTVDQRGTVHLLTDDSDTTGAGVSSVDATASVVLASGSVTEILPENLYAYQGSLVTPLENANASQGILQTALDAQRASNLSNSGSFNTDRDSYNGARLNDFNDLPDTQGESRIEISTGGTVQMQAGALALAQGGQVAVNAGQQIVLQSGATIDVSGTNAALPASDNDLLVSGIVPYYLRDSAANRTGGLEFGNVYADIQTLVEIPSSSGTTESSGYANNIYTSGGLLEVSGLLGLIGHGINEWSAIGGSITLQSGTASSGTIAGGTVALSLGSTINLTGGTVTYEAGMVQQSYVESTDGRIFNINDAPGDLVYTSVYTGETENHARWHITQTFVNPLLTPSEIEEPEYTIGRDAGNLTISAATALMDGTVAAGVTVGDNQNGARPATVTDPFLLAQTVVPQAAGLTVGADVGGVLQSQQFTSTVVLGDAGGDTPAPPPQTPQPPPEVASGTISIDTGALDAAGFANITILTAGSLTVANALTLADGGTVTLGGGNVTVNAGITAHSGTVDLTNLFSSDQPLSSTGGITVASGVRIDTSGDWTNLQTDPGNFTLAGYAGGGKVSIISTEGVDLAAGSVIDVSSGGALSTAGKLTNAAGGNVTISADIVPGLAADYVPGGDVTIAGNFVGYASGSAGTLSISVPEIVLGSLVGGLPSQLFVLNPQAVLALPDNALFASGFSDYVLGGYFGIEVDPGRTIAVTRPVYILNDTTVPTGQAAASAYSVVLEPLYTPSPGTDAITQRPGASIALESSIEPDAFNGQGGPIYIDAGASISVDPRQSITVFGYGQLTDLGTLTAHGGAITLANTRYEQPQPQPGADLPSNYVAGLSVWIGNDAVVDASGQSVTFTDALGRAFGLSQAGGTIVLGGLGGASASSTLATYAQVIERPGAVLDAAGADATVEAVPAIVGGSITTLSAPVTVAGNGGTIVATSYDGIAFDGALLAGGAGPGAAGGTLDMRMDPQVFAAFPDLPASYVAPSRILISQDAIAVQTTPGLMPGETTASDTSMLGRISAQQLAEGGFDAIDLYAQDYIAFDGPVSLQLGRSATFETGVLGQTSINSPGATIAAPYIDLVGFDPSANGGIDSYADYLVTQVAQVFDIGTLTLRAGLVDFSGALDIGGDKVIQLGQSNNGSLAPLNAVAFGFAATDIVSTGDIRFDQSAADSRTVLDSSGNITLQAAQVYPASGATAVVYAGDNQHISNTDTITNEFAGGTLTILGQPGAAPASPFSIGGTLALVSETLVQDGILRAPEGDLILGADTADFIDDGKTRQQVTNSVVLGPDSITSVSLFGQIVPYGGTVDGVNYDYAGSAVGTFAPTLAIATAQLTAEGGAQIDLRGGGTLAGAGFIPGRGGTADVNLTPLLNSGSGTVTANTTDPVYAIVKGYTDGYAPVAPGDAGYSTPGIGEQITIGAGEVAGLPAGTYTLLPAYYDLLPGGYRVELTGTLVAPGATAPFGNFTTIAAVQVGDANTSVIESLPQAALITPGNGVRQLSQYDEETYNTFEATESGTFGAPLPPLPQDAATLEIQLNSQAGTAGVSATPISIAAGTVLKAPAEFSVNGTAGIGDGATIEVTSSLPLEVLAPGEVADPLTSGTGTNTIILQAIGVQGGVLDALTQPVEVAAASGSLVEIGTRLVLGGTLTSSEGTLDIAGQTPDMWLFPQAYVTAADIVLTSSGTGTIELLGDATASTRGQGTVIASSGAGTLFSTQFGETAFPALAISNTNLQFVPTQNPAGAAIVVGQGVTLETETGGSLNFLAPDGTNVQIAPTNLVSSYIDLQVANINIGNAATLAEFAPLLPGGFTLTDAALNTLAQNATLLSLTAEQAVNILGDVSLNSGKTDLVLNTPAMYGYGISGAGTLSQGGTVSIIAPNFTWGGVASEDTLQNENTTAVSATPGGMLSGSVGGSQALTLDGAASLLIDATGTLTLGYGPDVPQNDQVLLDRLAVGFATVTLQGGTEITANNQSALSVYQTQPTQGEPGTGGNLTVQTPLVTADSGAVLQLNAGGAFIAAGTGTGGAATATVATLGAEIDIAANTVATSTSIALPSGRLSITADSGIDLAAGTNIDLSGRATKIFDETAPSNGGTLTLEDDAASATAITEDAGAIIDVASSGAAAGSVSATDLGGTVAFNGTLTGNGATAGGSFTLAADAITPASFDALNAQLDAGGFSALRGFELASGNIVVDQTVAAHIVDIAADSGDITVTGTIDAAGVTPGSITLSAGDVLTLGSTALLDAHATETAVNRYGNAVNAENAALITLTSTGSIPGGSVVLDPGASINVSYPGSSNDPQGQVVIDAPRLPTGNTGLIDVAVSAPGSLNIIGAAAIDLYAFRTYTPTDPDGTIVQDTSAQNAPNSPPIPAGAVGLVQIGQDSTAYMAQVDADGATLAAGQLFGLAAYGTSFNLAPGVEIASSAASNGNLTISGDLDFSALRYSDPAQFGIAVNQAVAGSGEAGAIIFRATNDLTVNGSVTDGFLPPPDTTLGQGQALTADTAGWSIYDNPGADEPWIDPTNSDLLLPSSAYGTYTVKGKTYDSTEVVLLGASAVSGSAATIFDTTRPISLNYAITIQATDLKNGVTIPFAVTVGPALDSQANTPVPAGGWIATASVTRGGVVIFQKGQLIPAGFTFEPGDVLGAGFVLPVIVSTAQNQLIPAGTSFDVFASTTSYSGSIVLSQDTAPLPADALIPSETQAFFGVEYSSNGSETVADIKTLDLRPTSSAGVQGYLYPLAQMLPAGSQSWSMDFVAGANAAAADANAVQPLTTLNGGAIAPTYTEIDQAPGSLLIDDQHYFSYTPQDMAQQNYSAAITAFSVIRTGTGDLSLVAGGNIDQSSLYGIYTAGTQDPLGGGQDAQFNSARQSLGSDGAVLPGDGKIISAETANFLIAGYQAYYPNDGGNVLVAAQGDMTGDVYADPGGDGSGAPASDVVGNWLWRQGSTQLGQPTAWWINFGTLVDPLDATGALESYSQTTQLQMTGFQGIGALGGGNVTVTIGGNAGQMSDRDESGEGGTSELGPGIENGEGLVIAVGATGRLLDGSATPITTGGGDLTLTIGGTLNPLDAAAYGTGASPTSQSGEAQAVNGDVIDVSGNISVTAGAIGRIDYVTDSGTSNLFDPRETDPDAPNDGVPNGGIVVVPGDGAVDITTDRDLVLGGVGDPGRIAEQSLTASDTLGSGTGGYSGFSLWQADTSISLFSAGGNVTPTSVPNESTGDTAVPSNDLPTDFRSEYPPTLLVTAATGDIIYGQNGLNPSTIANLTNSDEAYDAYPLETMPSPTGEVSFLAGTSIFANGYAIDMSGANPAGLSGIIAPAFQSIESSGEPGTLTNVLTAPQTGLTALSLFALEADTPTSDLHADDPTPARFYAAGGDIVNFQTGETLNFVQQNGAVAATWYIAAKPVWIEAANDIVSTGTRPNAYPANDPLLYSLQENLAYAPGNAPDQSIYSSGNLFLNNDAADISVISAGRDILSAYAYIIGPGLLEVDAGRNLYQAGYTLGATQVLSFGAFRSLGDDYLPGSTPNITDGAGIAVLAGVGDSGADYTAFAELYFNPDEQANLSIPITAPANQGKVQQVYTSQLLAWLQTNYGYTGTAKNALAYFLSDVPSLDEAVFVRQVFFTELTASGAQESDPNSKFYKDYIRGQQAIDTLFPSTDGATGSLGVPAGYTGGITAYSGPILLQTGTEAGPQDFTVDGGIATLFGGTVQILDPGGNVEFGIPGGPTPGNESGIITYGTGDVDIYALDSVLLGKSRIFTTGGGNITIWSSSGDINAGIGAKTTVSYNPPTLVYDDVGDVSETPPDSTSGAGIATLQPLPSVPAGDVSLIAPVGTVDAGEAGVRVSGNLVLAASRVSGTANITVKGTTAGAPTVNVASIGAVEAAGAAAGASTSAAQNQSGRNAQSTEVTSVLDVEVLTIGGSYEDERKKRKHTGI